jgi:hypothetical protein
VVGGGGSGDRIDDHHLLLGLVGRPGHKGSQQHTGEVGEDVGPFRGSIGEQGAPRMQTTPNCKWSVVGSSWCGWSGS